MKRLFLFAIFCVLCLTFVAGQTVPALRIYSSDEGYFQFAYPDSFQLWAGARIPRTKGSREAGFIPVCDPNTAFVCAVYPAERFSGTTFEAAGFSVNNIQSAKTEEDCDNYQDRLSEPRSAELKTSKISINGTAFSHTATGGAATGHSQSLLLYRNFHHGYCYELRIAISVTDAPSDPQLERFSEASAENVREALQRILGTFSFMK